MKQKIVTIGLAALMLTEAAFVSAEEVSADQSVSSMISDSLMDRFQTANGIIGGSGSDEMEDVSLGMGIQSFVGGMEGEAATLSGSIIPIVDDSQREMARCYLPEGWQMGHQEMWCTFDTGIFTPGRVFIQEQNTEGDLVLGYYSPNSYIEYVLLDANGIDVTPQQDEWYDYDYMTPAKRFLEVDGYCDYLASQIISGVNLSVVSETKPNAQSYEKLQQKRIQSHQEAAENFAEMEVLLNQAGGGLVTVDVNVNASYCGQHEKEYSFVANGEEYRLIVSAQVSGIQVSTSTYTPIIYGGGALTSNQVINFWGADSVHYALMPASKAVVQRQTFEQFVLNTRVSDEYMAVLDTISLKLFQAIVSGRNSEISVYYPEIESDIQSGLSESSYDDDRYSDYILDQNEYVTASGDEIKVSTAYDYVYEDGNGNIYASNTVLDGMERLYPNT